MGWVVAGSMFAGALIMGLGVVIGVTIARPPIPKNPLGNSE